MTEVSNHINEMKTAEAFSRQSKVFDEIYGKDKIIAYKRERVRKHIAQYLSPGSGLLELNCGSGEDAIYFASQGHRVHATDLASGMMEVMREKVRGKDYQNRITSELCSFTELAQLENKGPFDYIYSNFGGLNCSPELDKVLRSMNTLIKPGGVITLVIISKFCLWETLLLFKGKFKTAFRRFGSSKGRSAHVEGTYFKCWYYSPGYVARQLVKEYDLLSLEGLCTIVPPSYIEDFAEKRPRLFSFLKNRENKWKGLWPWKLMGDYYIISFRKK